MIKNDEMVYVASMCDLFCSRLAFLIFTFEIFSPVCCLFNFKLSEHYCLAWRVYDLSCAFSVMRSRPPAEIVRCV
jgi:hypothetical protein